MHLWSYCTDKQRNEKCCESDIGGKRSKFIKEKCKNVPKLLTPLHANISATRISGSRGSSGSSGSSGLVRFCKFAALQSKVSVLGFLFRSEIGGKRSKFIKEKCKDEPKLLSTQQCQHKCYVAPVASGTPVALCALQPSSKTVSGLGCLFLFVLYV